jgi:hypothetical protein
VKKRTEDGILENKCTRAVREQNPVTEKKKAQTRVGVTIKVTSSREDNTKQE